MRSLTSVASTMHSALYTGLLRHRRFAPREHEFSYRLFMVYVDLAELQEVFRGRWLWSVARPAVAWLRRRDYLGDPAVSLDTAVRDRVAAETGVRPDGPIRMLTHLRYFGIGFNPVTFYYCFDRAGRRVQSIVAEITNTPWNERHAYVLPDVGSARALRYRIAKQFHVSPFLPMDLSYDWRFSQPGARLSVHMEDLQDDRKIFDATLTLQRREISGASLATALVAFPFMTARVVSAIYWQALRLWLKRIPFHSHPERTHDPASDLRA
jgi:uncharacterized protein